MASFEDLLAELDLYGAEGEPATLWWRDDDAIEPTDPLARMIDLAERHAVPLTIAVIPAGLKPSSPTAVSFIVTSPRRVAINEILLRPTDQVA